MRSSKSSLLLASVLLITTSVAGAQIAERAEDIRPIVPGTEAPSETVRQMDGTSVELASLLEDGPTILVFYRGGWCPYCTLQLSSLAKIVPDLGELGVQLIAVSPDRPEKLVQSVEASDLDYTLVSDSSAALMKAYGVAFRLDEKTLETYREYGIDLAAASGESHDSLPVPSVFVIDAEGVVQFAYANPDYRTRLPERLVRAAAEAVAAGEFGRPLK